MFHKPVKSGLNDLAAFAGAFVQAALRFLIPVEGSIEFVVKEVSFLAMMSRGAIRQTIDRARKRINFLISSIALTSLLVGSVGAMKIRLVTVVERAHALVAGVAVGARPRDMLLQLPIESDTVCLPGGTLGICLALPRGLASNQGSCVLQPVFPSHSIVASFDLSTIAEIISGIASAYPTADLDPIEALVRE